VWRCCGRKQYIREGELNVCCWRGDAREVGAGEGEGGRGDVEAEDMRGLTGGGCGWGGRRGGVEVVEEEGHASAACAEV